MAVETKQNNEYLSLHRRSAGDRLLYAVYWLLVILSWPIYLVGICGIGIGIVPVLIGNIRDPKMDDAITSTVLGAAIFGVGFGIRALANLIAAKSFSPANSFKLGTSYSHIGKIDRAVVEFSRALARCPEMTAARVSRAVCNGALSKLQEAEEEIAAVLEHHPDWARAHFARAMIACQREQYQEAEKHFRNALAASEKALERKPESVRDIFRAQDEFALLHVPTDAIKQAITQCETEASKATRSQRSEAET